MTVKEGSAQSSAERSSVEPGPAPARKTRKTSASVSKSVAKKSVAKKDATPENAAATAEIKARPRAKRPAAEPSDCKVINSLARGLKVLSAFGPEDVILSNKDLAVRACLPKPTISRLTSTLARLNFLTKDAENGGYRLGEAALALGISASAKVDLPHVARPFMRDFANEHEIGVSLGVRDGMEIRSLAYITGEMYGEEGDEVGARLALFARQPLGASSSGFALLSSMSIPERAALIEQLRGQFDVSEWGNKLRRMELAFADIDRYGYCWSMREWDRMLNAVGTPLYFANPGIPFSLSCNGLASAMPESRIRNKLGPALLELKHKISDAFRQQRDQS